MENFNLEDPGSYMDRLEQQTAEEANTERTQAAEMFIKGMFTFISLCVVAYTSYHGINATAQFRASGIGGLISGVSGVIVIELLFLLIPHGMIYGWIRGGRVHTALMAAISVASLFFIIANVIVDSQLNAQMGLSENLRYYLHYILPIACVILLGMLLLAEYFSPDSIRKRKEAEAKEKQRDAIFNTRHNMTMLQLGVVKQKASLQAQNQQKIAQAYSDALSSDRTQQALESLAARNAGTALQKEYGIAVDDGFMNDLDRVTHRQPQTLPQPPQVVKPQPIAVDNQPSLVNLQEEDGDDRFIPEEGEYY